MQRWFKETGLNASARVKQARPGRVKRGQGVHQVWAVDAKEKMLLQDGTRVSWLTISDEASGSILQTEVFPPRPVEPSGSAGGSSQSDVCL